MRVCMHIMHVTNAHIMVNHVIAHEAFEKRVHKWSLEVYVPYNQRGKIRQDKSNQAHSVHRNIASVARGLYQIP